jgi:hypothetical protein
MAPSIGGAKAHRKTMLPMICSQPPCRNIEVAIVSRWRPCAMSFATADQRYTQILTALLAQLKKTS